MNHPVKIERERQGLTLDQLSTASGVSVRSLHRAESFQAVSGETQGKISVGLGVPVGELFVVCKIGAIIAGPDGGAFQVTATTSAGDWVIVPLEFGEVRVKSADALRAEFGVTVQAAAQPERNGYAALAEASRLNANQIAQAEATAERDQARIDAAELRGWDAMAAAMDEAR